MVVIDTLQRVRSAGSDSNLYANDYQDIGLLKKLADNQHIAILLIHHLRKLHDDDPMNIYALYLQGCGQKEIARRLNRLGRKTPAQIMTERLGYDSQKPHKTRDGQFLWAYASVKNILVEEAYTGVLVNHRREYCGGKARAVNEADWLRHENFYPVIIEKADWKQVQALLKQQARPAVNNRTKHR